MQLRMTPEHPKTISQTVCEHVTDEILRGKLVPGERLDEQSLADRFRVSRSPIRDALRQLAATRLVLYVPHKGFSVASVSSLELDELFEASGEVEALCARLCSLRAGPAERKRLQLVHEQAGAAARARDANAYSRFNDELHILIYAGARNAALREIALNLRQRLAPFRSRVFFTTDNRMEASHREHAVLVRSIVAHDGEAARRAMQEHAAQSAMNALRYFGVEDVPRRRAG